MGIVSHVYDRCDPWPCRYTHCRRKLQLDRSADESDEKNLGQSMGSCDHRSDGRLGCRFRLQDDEASAAQRQDVHRHRLQRLSDTALPKKLHMGIRRARISAFVLGTSPSGPNAANSHV